MKQELPIAITLLAIGCLLWFWQTKQASEASAAIQHPNVPAPATEPEFKQLVGSQQLSGAQILEQIATSLRDGAPVFGDLEITSHLLGNAETIQARFWNQGQGTRQTRLELILDSANPIKLTQICDGRFQYRLMEHRDTRQLKFHDLQRLNNDDAGIIKATLPASWVGAGSFDSLLRHLADAFNFGEVKTSSGDPQLMEIVGTWNPDRLFKLMSGRVDHREILPTPNWSKLPAQLPHGVRLRFRSEPDTGWQPVEILFFKFNENVTEPPSPAMSIKFVQIRHQSISDDLFRFEFDEAGAIDETEIYNQHIDLITGKNRVAEETGNAIR